MTKTLLLASITLTVLAAGCSSTNTAGTTPSPEPKKVAPPVNGGKTGGPEAVAPGNQELSINPNGNIETPGSKLKGN